MTLVDPTPERVIPAEPAHVICDGCGLEVTPGRSVVAGSVSVLKQRPDRTLWFDSSRWMPTIHWHYSCLRGPAAIEREG